MTPEKYTVVYAHYNNRSNWMRMTAISKEEAYHIKNDLEQCGYYVRGVYPEYKK